MSGLKTLLQLSSVTKSFGAVRALKGVSFDLRAGEVHALLGENGAGKSTLIKIVTGAHQPDDGGLEIAGQPIRHLTPAAAHRLGIACIYQQPALFPDLSVAENIALRLEPARAVRTVDWSARQTRATELLQRLGAAISPEAEVRSLSMPEQQLVEIACALGAGARIVIMDEPTASLTQKEQQLLFGVVRSLRESGVGIIYISHRLDEIFQLADRVTVLRDGESVGTREVRARQTPHPGPLPKGEGESQTGLSANGEIDSTGSAPSVLPLHRGEGRGEGECDTQASALTESELIKLMVGREVSTIYPRAEGEAGKVVLSLKQLSCAASGVRDVSLEVRAGEVVGLAGLVGAGRTELARVLFGITPADAGEILLNGQRVRIRSPQEAVAHGIAYVPEDRRRHGVILEMPIAHNLTMAIHRRMFPGTWLRFGAEKQLAAEFIRDLEVKTYGPEAPGASLSGGNQQKISLARWLATNPRLLILDEPTQGVDVGAKSEIHKLIRRLAREGLAVLMISSDLPEILGMSDRIAVMGRGSIVAMLPGRSDAHEVMAAALGQACGNPKFESRMSKEIREPKPEGEAGDQSLNLGVQGSFGFRNPGFDFLRRHFRELSVAAALLVLLLALAIFAPAFYQPQPLLSLLTREAPTLVVACGMALVIVSRQIDISVGSQFAVCGVSAGLLASMNWPLVLVLPACVVLGALLGAVNGVLIAGLRLPSIVVTLATMVTWREALRWLRQGEFVNLPDGVQWFGLNQMTGQLLLLAVALALLLALAYGMKNLAAGRFVYAVGSDAEAARLAGIRPQLTTFCVFVFMGALVGLAAMMNVVQSPQVDPKSGTGLELKVIAAVVVGGVAISGGRGNLWGVFAGLLLLACISPALTHLRVEAYWEKAIQGAIILLAVVADGVRSRKERH